MTFALIFRKGVFRYHKQNEVHSVIIKLKNNKLSIDQQKMSCQSRDIIFSTTDVIHTIASFLNDDDACKFFRTNKTVNNVSKNHRRYKIKKNIKNVSVPSQYIITSLTITDDFSVIPSNIVTLTLINYKNSVNISIVHCNQLKFLNVHGNINITEYPETIQNLRISDCDNLVKIPDTLINLRLSNTNIILPKSVKYLELSLIANNNEIEQWPDNLLHLSLDTFYNFELNNLPSSLKYLNIGEYFDKHIEFPSNLTHFLAGNSFDQSIENIPESLTYLKLGYNFNHKIPSLNKLKRLRINKRYSQSLKHIDSNIVETEY